MSEFKYHSTNAGFCRVYYTYTNRHGEKILYCLQNDGKPDGINFYRCSKDREPSHRVKYPDKGLPMSPGEHRIDDEVNDFISKKYSMRFSDCYANRRVAKVYLSDGSNYTTEINGTREEIYQYFAFGKTLNIGDGADGDKLVKVTNVEIFDHLEHKTPKDWKEVEA